MLDQSNPSVAIILVNWNGFEYTRVCLQSLSKIDYKNHQIFLVDNGSTDGSMIKLKAEFNGIKYIESKGNLGFTGGNNLGIEAGIKAGFDLILLLNNDTEVEPGFLSKLVGLWKEKPNLGIIQPLIFFNQERNIIWSAGGIFQKWLGTSKTLADRLPESQYMEKVSRKLDWATGCCMLIPSKVFKEVGLLNNSFFAYFEDVDFSLRVKKHGYDIGIEPSSIIYHEAGAASKKQTSGGILNPKVFYLTARNQLFQLKMHTRFPQSIVAWPYQIVKFLMWTTYFCMRLRFKKVKAVTFGIYDGISKDPRLGELYPPR